MAAKTEKFEPAGRKKRAKGPNQVGAEIIAEQQQKLRLMPGTMPFLQDPSGKMYGYNGRFWDEVTEHTLVALVFEHPDGAKAAHRFRREVVHYIAAACHRREHTWARVADHEVPCWNGVVDVRSGEMRPHRAEDYLENVLPWPYEERANCPTLGEVVGTHFPGDTARDEREQAMQLFFGYIVLPHARGKKAALLHGEPDCGKSLWAMMARELVGARFTCSLPVEDMDDPVKRAVLVGKKLNILTELPHEAMIADGGFKTLVSTEEPILVNPKYERPFTYVPAAKHMIVTNSLPTVNDKTEATFNRLLIVPFTERIENPDRFILDRLKKEMTGILRWAIEGARALVDSGFEWPQLEGARSLVEEMREAQHPIKQFVTEEMTEAPEEGVPLSLVTQRFNKWKAGGRPMTVHAVGKALRKAYGKAVVRKLWRGTDEKKGNAVCFAGWKFNDVNFSEMGTYQTGTPPAPDG